jgi:hypothetical protein
MSSKNSNFKKYNNLTFPEKSVIRNKNSHSFIVEEVHDDHYILSLSHDFYYKSEVLGNFKKGERYFRLINKNFVEKRFIDDNYFFYRGYRISYDFVKPDSDDIRNIAEELQDKNIPYDVLINKESYIDIEKIASHIMIEEIVKDDKENSLRFEVNFLTGKVVDHNS